MKQQKMMNRSNKFANQRIELWATENSFLFNTADLLERESPILVRKNHNQIDTEQFIYVLKILINNKSYGNNAIHHSNHMTYKIHSLSGRLGTLRFLPWHRIFLFELEEMMQAFSPGISIPYWDWTRDREIPNWLKDYTPNVPYNNETYSVFRRPFGSPNPFKLPIQEDVDKVLSLSTYEEFTKGLEGGIREGPNETETSLHNEVHNWIGGTMGDIKYSPMDPCFWLHHANIDHIWAIWQNEHPNEHPNLNGTDAIMNPWNDHNEVETRNTENLHYKYE